MMIDELGREDLLKLVKMYAKNWLAHDGCWFLAAEKRHGLEEAIQIDKDGWIKFTVIEAKRIMKEFSISRGTGIDGLEKALQLRMYASVNIQELQRETENVLILDRIAAVRSNITLESIPPER